MASSARRILFVSHDAGRTGAPIGLLAFMRWLCANTDYRIGTLLRAPGPLEASFRELGPTVTLGHSLLFRSRLGRRLCRLLPRDVREETGKIRRMFLKGSYDLIYSSTITNGTILEGLASFGVPVITHVHELAYWIWRAGTENLQRALAHTTAFVAASEAVRENLVRVHGVPEEKITVIYEHIRELPAIPTATEKASARAALGIPDGAFVVGGCGAEHWRKGRDLVPQLLLALRCNQPEQEFHFVWIGRPGTAEEEFSLQHDLQCAGASKYFHTVGEVENPFEFYPAMDVFALLSRDDPYPLASLEAAALELPVLCFAGGGGMQEFVRDGCGFAAPYLDLNVMARDIARLADDPQLARKIGQRARAKVAQESVLEATAPRLRAVIDRLLGQESFGEAVPQGREAPSTRPRNEALPGRV